MIVLNLHGLGDPHSGVDDDERPYWLGVEHFTKLVDRITSRSDRTQFSFTFDDGNKSDLIGASVLAERGFSARFFVLAGRLSQPKYLSREDLIALKDMGMTIGLHGRDHVDWRKLDDKALEDETVTARAEIEDALGQAVDEVAIPFGAYDRRVMNWLKDRRFTRIHTSDGGPLRDRAAKIWPRNTLRADMKEERLDVLLSGRWTLAQRARQAGGQLYRRHIA
ncbi:polysaccharide deacetylase family protein [Altererythrobacter lutimaris]|uniref:Chitooligosaccharide deacetylase n=1 Tax=Altererythrobacter lutimaris TaxID=2743979 RepID=A0A850H7J2_9SPHN|nr:polysaccharide deacetylase family protein [Altererythrobacter lutimaris]NVE95137.1 polysaccharide deacetylase family protein [Altererythrobacter lutimaris]